MLARHAHARRAATLRGARAIGHRPVKHQVRAHHGELGFKPCRDGQEPQPVQEQPASGRVDERRKSDDPIDGGGGTDSDEAKEASPPSQQQQQQAATAAAQQQEGRYAGVTRRGIYNAAALGIAAVLLATPWVERLVAWAPLAEARRRRRRQRRGRRSAAGASAGRRDVGLLH